MSTKKRVLIDHMQLMLIDHLHRIDAKRLCCVDEKGGPSIELWSKNGKPFIVWYKPGDRLNTYIPATASNRIDDTLNALDNYLMVQSPARKEPQP